VNGTRAIFTAYLLIIGLWLTWVIVAGVLHR
jgi:hypothetical protein